MAGLQGVLNQAGKNVGGAKVLNELVSGDFKRGAGEFTG